MHRPDSQNQRSPELTFGALVRELRLASGMTQEELAERAGISARSVSDLERGLYQTPHRDTVGRLAVALQLDATAAARLESAVVRQRGPQPRGREEVAQLPTGTVTFLSIQVESSGASTAPNPERIGDALERVDTLVRRRAEEHHGALVQAHGGADSRVVAFRTPSEAAGVAIEIQRLFEHELSLKLRMALHTGEADLRDGIYYGSAINRSARLLAMAARDQTVVSQAASELLRPSLPEEASLRDLGDHHLSDSARPEHVFQLILQGTRHDAPALTAASTLHAHYETVVRGLLDGRLVVFAGDARGHIGAGPAASPTSDTWQPDQLDRPPTPAEVAAYLARTFDYPSDAPRELIRVAQYVSTMVGSGPLFEALNTVYAAEYRPTPLHEFLAALPSMLVRSGRAPAYPLILTSSYDHALERAFAQAGEQFDLVSYIAEGELRGRFLHWPPDGRSRLIDRPNKYSGLSLDTRTVIVKVHGTTDRDNPEHASFVVAEDHFLDYLTGSDMSNLIPVTIAARLRRAHFLFLAYDLRTWNLRVILRRLWGEQQLSYKSWAVHPFAPDPMERGLWRDRGIDVLEVQLEDYLRGLRERLQAGVR